MPKIFIPLTQQKFIILLKRVIEGKKKIIKYEDISRDWSQEEAETKIQLYKDILGRTPRKTTDIDKIEAKMRNNIISIRKELYLPLQIRTGNRAI